MKILADAGLKFYSLQAAGEKMTHNYSFWYLDLLSQYINWFLYSRLGLNEIFKFMWTHLLHVWHPDALATEEMSVLQALQM